MKILSIDVGIKNLAFCLLEKPSSLQHFKITKWDIINISEQEDNLLCDFTEKNVICNKPAKFKKNDQCFCLKHSKKQPNLQIPTSQQKPAFINKQKIQKLCEIATSHGIKYQPKIKKIDLVQLINEYIHQNYFENIESKKADKIELFDIGLNIKTKFNKLFETEGKIDYVIIENQISPIATRMKTIQGMIVQYFIMSNIQVDHIEFISAANKLKDFGTNTNNSENNTENNSKHNVYLGNTEKQEKPKKSEKTKYSDRKKMGISKCLEIITNDFRFNEHVNYFSKHKKKDDLSDSFLQGLWFIHHHKL